MQCTVKFVEDLRDFNTLQNKLLKNIIIKKKQTKAKEVSVT